MAPTVPMKWDLGSWKIRVWAISFTMLQVIGACRVLGTAARNGSAVVEIAEN